MYLEIERSLTMYDLYCFFASLLFAVLLYTNYFLDVKYNKKKELDFNYFVAYQCLMFGVYSFVTLYNIPYFIEYPSPIMGQMLTISTIGVFLTLYMQFFCIKGKIKNFGLSIGATIFIGIICTYIAVEQLNFFWHEFVWNAPQTWQKYLFMVLDIIMSINGVANLLYFCYKQYKDLKILS